MSRPIKNNCDYFPHVANMRNHRKVKALRKSFDNGYAIWCMLLEYITDADGNEFENSEMEYELMSGDFGFTASEIRDVVNYCIKLEMLFNKNNFIFSESLNEKLAPVFEKRGKARELSKKQMRVNGKFVSATETPTEPEFPIAETPDDPIIPSSDSPQSKENRIKENKKEIINVLKNDFEVFRKKYPGTKNGLDYEYLNFQKKHKDWKEVLQKLLPAIDSQLMTRSNKIKVGGFVPEWKNLQTWINQRCWEEEPGQIEPQQRGESNTVNFLNKK